MELQIGITVGPYRVEQYLAAGGMSLIYKVRHLERDSLHVLKVLAIHSRTVRERMQQEGQLQRLLDHPNIVPVTEVLQLAHTPALIMDFVAGPDLAVLLERCSLTDAQTDQLIRGILRGMIAAHANGMVHRDLKPSNILLELEDGVLVPRIGDFGLAKMWAPDDESPITQSGAMMGTPNYMAPEQVWDASAVDERADVFSLGAVMYEMLSGQRAFAGKHSVDVWSRITSGKREFLNSLRPDLPKEVVNVVHQAMATDRDQRIPDMRTLLSRWEQAWAVTLDQPGSPAEVWAGQTIDEVTQWMAARIESTAPDPSTSIYSNDAPSTLHHFALNSTGVDASVETHIMDIAAPFEHAAPSRSRPALGNLPKQGDEFIGRTAELASVQEHLSHDRPILTLAGPGGMGKTRLSLKVGEQVQSRFPGGVWFCDLTASRNHQDVLDAVAQALGIPLNEKKAATQLAHAIHGRGRLLIILDNMEQVVEHAADTVGQWVKQAPSARFIVTSRIRMGLQSEEVFELGPIDTAEGVELFETRARDLNAAYVLPPEDRAAVTEIVERVDGMSLAIELAAARTQMLRPRQILERLEQRFRLLSSGRRDQTARQSTLEGAIDWSWDLLSDVERSALTQCSVFRGGFDLDAAEAVIDLQPWDVWPMDVVQALVQQSLIRATEPIPGIIRFQLYESIREYAEQKLGKPGAVTTADGQSASGPGPTAAIRRRHSAYYARLGEEGTIEARFWGAEPDVRRAFRLERENLAQAIAFGTQCPPRVHALATVAWGAIYRWYGPYLPALAVVKQAMARQDLDPVSRLALCETAGGLHADSDQSDEAAACAAECLELARMTRDLAAEGRAVTRYAFNRRREIAPAALLAAHEEALPMLRMAGDKRGEIDALMNICAHHEAEENQDALFEVVNEVIEKSVALGCLWQEARALRARASWYMVRGRMDLGEADLKRALSNAQCIERPLLLVEVNGALGTLYKDLGTLEESIVHHEIGMRLSREIGNRRIESILMGNMALVLQLQGKEVEAEQLYRDTIRLDDSRGSTVIGHMAMGNLGDLLLNQGKLAESTEQLTEAIALLDSKRSVMAGPFRGSLAWARAQLGEFEEARALLGRGEEQLRGLWAVELGRLLCRRAQVEYAAACISEAEVALTEAREIAAQLGGSEDSDLGQMIAETARMLSA